MSRTENVFRGLVWGIGNRLLLVIVPFINRTIIIYTLGMQYLGLSGLFTSVLSILNLTELGFGTAIVYSMYKPMAENDVPTINVLLSFYKKCYRLVGLVVLAAGLAVMPFLRCFIAGTLPSGLNIYILYALYLLNAVLSYFLFAYKRSILLAAQRVDFESKISNVVILLRSLGQLAVLLLFKNYYFFVGVTIVATAVENLFVARVTKKRYSQFTANGHLPRAKKQAIYRSVRGILLQKIGIVILFSSDSMVISAFLGLEALAVYGNYYQIITAVNSVMGMIQSVLIPSVGNAISVESKESNLARLEKLNFQYVVLVSFVCIAMACLYQPFMALWVGAKYLVNFPVMLLFVLYFFIYKWCDMLYVFQSAAGVWWENRFVPLLASVCNVVFNILLIKPLGLAGILLATLISVLLFMDIGYAVILFKHYFANLAYVKRYFFTQAKYLCVAAVSCVLVYGCVSLVPGASWLSLFAKGAVCALGAALLLALAYHRNPHFKASLSLLKSVWVKLKTRGSV